MACVYGWLLCGIPGVEANAFVSGTFGPWDAGAPRKVVRQGKTGKTQAKHPMVGDAAKVPASGPPPPPLQLDPDVPEQALDAPNRLGGNLTETPLYLAALFYQHFLTKVDGPRCQHMPTCSRFASQAVARYGIWGIPLGLDRIIQDPHSSALRILPEVDVGDTRRFWDPLENYLFWKPELFDAFPPRVKEQSLELSQNQENRPPASRPSAFAPNAESKK